MDRQLIKYFYNCGDDQIIKFAQERAHLNAKERAVLGFILDECLSQEETAEKMAVSTRLVQDLWKSATTKMLNIPWVMAYAKELRE